MITRLEAVRKNWLWIVAIVVAGTRLRRTADHGLEPEVDAEERPALQPVPTVAAASHEVVPVRASDREREAAAACVGDAMGEGRLDLDEGVDRLDAVYRARDRAALEWLVADLPHRAPPRARATRVDRHGILGTAALVTVVGAAVAQMVAGAWVLWPVAVALLLPFLRPGRS